MGASITPENLTVRYATPPNSEPNLTTINRLVLIRARRYRVAVRMLTYRRVTHELQRRGHLVNHKRVARVMRANGLGIMGGRAGIAKGVVEDEVLKVDEFAVDPQGSTGIGEILPFEKAGADGRAGNTLIETGERDAGVEGWPHQGCHADFREIVSH